MNFLKKIIGKYLTNFVRTREISETREITPPENRDIKLEKLVMESFHCPYCESTKFVKRGFRHKKREKIQLYLCLSCNKTFTPYSTKGKHYPLSVMLDAISIYNLGYSLEETCRIVNTRLMEKTQQKTTLASGSLTDCGPNAAAPDLSEISVKQHIKIVKWNLSKGVDPRGVAPLQPDSTDQAPHRSRPTPNSVYIMQIQPSTLSNWLSETAELCRFSRMREYALKKYSPKEMVIHATLAHRQLYRYRFHQAKCDLMIKEEYQHRKFVPLQEFLELVPVECPHQYFQEGLRASEAPLTFSKKQMIVRAKQNYANKLCAFVLQSVKERKQRHEALQKFMLANDSVTVATEVPVYITRDDIEHMKTQLGFQIFNREIPNPKSQIPNKSEIQNSNDQNILHPAAEIDRDLSAKSLPKAEPTNDEADIAEIVKLPKLITGHIDILQIRNGQIHILDYKPKAEKERPIEQLTLYAMALSRLTGLRLFEFKCAWFDEKDYFEFYPLHVLHKPKKTSRRRRINTGEGIYKINQDREKILSVRPITL